MNDRPTPETDSVAQPSALLQYETVNANFARRLERERDEARAAEEKLKADIAEIHKRLWELSRLGVDWLIEREKAREELSAWKEARK